MEEKEEEEEEEIQLSVQNNIELKNQLQSDIFYYEKIIIKNKKKIKEIEKHIWKNCNHEWIDLDDGDYYSRIKHHCKYCKLYKHSYMYT